MTHGFKQRARIAFDQGVQQVKHLAVIQRAEHGAHIARQHFAFAKRNRLIGQAHGIAHRAVGRTAQQPQRVIFKRDVFDTEHVAQMLNHTLRGHVLERELQATGQNGRWQLLRIGGRQDELDVGRRLFEGFEQRIERVTGEHVHFVDQVDLEAPTARRVLHVIEQLTGVFDLGAAGGVDLDQVNKPAFVDFAAHRAFAARGRGDTCFTVQAFGDDPRNGGLAHATGTGKQVGVMQALTVQGIDQSLEHMGLADHFAERARTPFTCKNLITH